MAIFAFGEDHPDLQVKVLNEREARAGAGILLFFEPIQRVAPGQLAALAAVVVTVGLAVPQLADMPSPRMPGMMAKGAAGERDCPVPAVALAIGHEAQWKLHNGCN
jgi:hypothetical protein